MVPLVLTYSHLVIRGRSTHEAQPHSSASGGGPLGLLQGSQQSAHHAAALLASRLGVGEFTTHFRTYFSGDWNVHWGYGVLTHGRGHLRPPKTELFCVYVRVCVCLLLGRTVKSASNDFQTKSLTLPTHKQTLLASSQTRARPSADLLLTFPTRDYLPNHMILQRSRA